MSNKEMLAAILDVCNVQYRTNEVEEDNVVFHIDGEDTEIMFLFTEGNNVAITIL